MELFTLASFQRSTLNSFRSTLHTAFLYASHQYAQLHFLVSLRWHGFGRCLEVTTYCQPKDLVLCGDEGRKARSPTLRMGDLHFAELIMLIHEVLSKILLRPVLPNCSRDSQLWRFLSSSSSILQLIYSLQPTCALSSIFSVIQT